MAILYTNGVITTKTIAEFETFTAIRYSKTDSISYVNLQVSDTGALDLSAQLGTQNAIIAMSVGSNSLTAGAGGDFLFTGAGNDSLYGGLGDDILGSGLGDDVIYGGDGADLLQPGLFWTSTTDFIDSSVSGGHDTIYGGGGGDLISVVASHYADLTVFGGQGQDAVEFLYESGHAHVIAMGASQSIEKVSGRVVGGDGDDSFDFGAAALDAAMGVYGGSGNDLIAAHAGKGSLLGEDGNDTLFAGDQGSYLNGGAGVDELHGGAGNDTLVMFLDGDQVFGGGGSDFVRVVVGNDPLSRLDLSDMALWAAAIALVSLGGGPIALTGTKDANLFNFGGGANVAPVTLNGAAGNDTLIGTAYADAFNGGSGADSMVGAAGNDNYIVDDAGDIVVELAGEGNDAITTSVFGFHMVANVERLNLGGTGAQLAYGGDGNDTIWLTQGITEATLFGGGGDDRFLGVGKCLIYGGAGNDVMVAGHVATLKGGSGNDDLEGNGGDDQLFGGTGDDTLLGGEGNDLLSGGTGADVLTGGLGDDYYEAAAGDTVTQDAGGHDTLVASFVDWTISLGIEDFISTANIAVHVVGNAEINAITTTKFADTLEGGFSDTLTGGKGNDTYIVSDITANIRENAGGGTDKIVLSLDGFVLGGVFDLTLPDNVEQLDYTLSGGVRIQVTGNAANNLIVLHHGGDDTVDGGLGNDTMDGGDGNDFYVVDSLGDVIKDTGNTTADEVHVFVDTWVLNAGTELLQAELAVDCHLTGNGAKNLIFGNDGNDVINGAAGNDALVGWNGHDSLTGGLGADRFVFGASPLAGSRDTITDFVHGTDKIFLASANGGAFGGLALNGLAPDAFKLIGAAKVDSSDRILYNVTTGALFYDADGLGGATAVQIATIANHATLTESDFWVI